MARVGKTHIVFSQEFLELLRVRWRREFQADHFVPEKLKGHFIGDEDIQKISDPTGNDKQQPLLLTSRIIVDFLN